MEGPQGAQGCVQFVNQKYEFTTDEETRTTNGVKAWGIIQNVCDRYIRNPTVEMIVFTEGVPSHVFKHWIIHSLDPGEMHEFNFNDKIFNSPDDVRMCARWDNY